MGHSLQIYLRAKKPQGRYIFCRLEASQRTIGLRSRRDVQGNYGQVFLMTKASTRRLGLQTLCQYFNYLFRNCAISGGSSHSPRRTRITNLADKGVCLRVLQRITLHPNLSITQFWKLLGVILPLPLSTHLAAFFASKLARSVVIVLRAQLQVRRLVR